MRACCLRIKAKVWIWWSFKLTTHTQMRTDVYMYTPHWNPMDGLNIVYFNILMYCWYDRIFFNISKWKKSYLFVSNSLENYTINKYQTVSWFFQYVFILWDLLLTTTSPECPIGPMLCIYWSRPWKRENAKNFNTSPKVSQTRKKESACSSYCQCQHF